MSVAHIFDGFDLPILRFLCEFAGRSSLFDHVVNALSRLDLFKGIALMCLFWYVWAETPVGESLLLREERQKRLVRVLIGTILLGALSRVMQVLLPIHQRPVLADLGLSFPITGFNAESLSNWNSFPSDHSVFFFALATGLWAVDRRVGVIAFLWTLVIIDLPRIYLGIHYPSDIVAGALMGFVGMKVVLALPLKGPERILSGWCQRHAGVFAAAMFFATDEVGHLLAEARALAESTLHVLGH
jgi:undecaprenyl-diphosphatase